MPLPKPKSAAGKIGTNENVKTPPILENQLGRSNQRLGLAGGMSLSVILGLRYKNPPLGLWEQKCCNDHNAVGDAGEHAD